MLQEAQTAFAAGTAADSFLQTILNQYPEALQRKRIVSQLALALTISTRRRSIPIHGFCQRILLENALKAQPCLMPN